jgi:hypothetical protein
MYADATSHIQGVKWWGWLIRAMLAAVFLLMTARAAAGVIG